MGYNVMRSKSCQLEVVEKEGRAVLKHPVYIRDLFFI
jgi:hypothetical protein